MNIRLKNWLTSLLYIVLILSIPFGFSHANDGEESQEVKERAVKEKLQNKNRKVYGWELMSKQERITHQNKMRSLQTLEEREAYRTEHHKKMRARAKKKGLTLQDRPLRMREKGKRGKRK